LGEHRSATWRGALRLLTEPRFRTLVVVGSMFGLFTIADAFIYLTFQNRSTFETAYFPLLYVGTAISYLLLAIPVGNLADRVGRSRVFLAGYVLLLCVYLVLLAPSLNGWLLVVLLTLLGAFYASTDGVLIAMTSVAVSEARRSSGIAVLTTAGALSGFAASLTFGAMWSWWGPTTTVKLFAGALGIVIVIAAGMLRVRTRVYG
jgi:MFS family permease